MSIEPFASLMFYKSWADEALLSAVSRLPWLARLLIGPLLIRVIRHFHAVDCIFRSHLLGERHGFASANPEGPITLAALKARVRETDEWYVAYARTLAVQSAEESLDLTFTDGDRQCMTRAQMLLHVALHGAYHRGNADILLRLCGAPVLPDRFTTYLRRAGSGAEQ
jgi:uncharacterized damage-inducible protein DinB